jgi:hypothetical protein
MIVNPRVKDFAIVFLAGFALTAMYEAVRCHEQETKPGHCAITDGNLNIQVPCQNIVKTP